MRKLSLSDAAPSGPKNKKTVLKKKKLAQKPEASNSNSKKYYCPLCKEQYTEPPTEEWIQCIRCMDWWHEQCTFYEGGSFECDHCQEDSS